MFLQSTPSSDIIPSQVSLPSSTCDSSNASSNLSVTNSLLSSINKVTSRCEICNFCHLLTSSSAESLNFDWKTHKNNCCQWRKRVGDTDSLPSDSLRSSVSSSSCSPPSTSSDNGLPQERIIETDDPEIQIIESGTHKMEVPKTRKRAFDKYGRAFKDHSKNLLYKVTFQEHIKALVDRGILVNQHQATALRLKYIAEHVIRSLNEYGWAVVDNFLGDKYCSKAYTEVERLYEKGMFSAGKLMDRGKFDLNPEEIRSDKIFWFGTDNGDETVRKSLTIRLLISMIDSVVVHFKNRIPPFDIAGRSKAMIAVYPGNGTRYVKHVDNPVKDGRCITTIYYCNEGWKLAEHGGTLRLYPQSSEVPMDVDPQADRLIFFWSDRRIPHEVLPVFRHRYAITIWYFDFEERRKAIERNNGNLDENSSEATTATAVVTTTSSGIIFNSDGVIRQTDKPLKQNTFEFLRNNNDLIAARKSLQEHQSNTCNATSKLAANLMRRSSDVTINQKLAGCSSNNNTILIDDRLFKTPTMPAVRCNMKQNLNTTTVCNAKLNNESVIRQHRESVINRKASLSDCDNKVNIQKIDGYCSEKDEEDIDDVVAQVEAKRKQNDYFEI